MPSVGSWELNSWNILTDKSVLHVGGCDPYYKSFPGGFTNNVIYGECLSLWGFGASVTEVSHVGVIYICDWPPIKTLDNPIQVSLPCQQDFAHDVTNHCWRNYAHSVWLCWEGILGSLCWFPADFAPCSFSFWDLTISFCYNKLYLWIQPLGPLHPFRDSSSLMVVFETPDSPGSVCI